MGRNGTQGVPTHILGPLLSWRIQIRKRYLYFYAVERYFRSPEAKGPYFELGGRRLQVGGKLGIACRPTTIIPK
jgi:hypothetical protein